MAKVTWSYGEGKAKESEVAKVEKALGIRFPDDYRTFVKTHRGGTPSPQELKIRGRRSPGVFRTLLNFIASDCPVAFAKPERLHDRIV